jgi:pimeloyl-ACP methyl ester carboxylesterase
LKSRAAVLVAVPAALLAIGAAVAAVQAPSIAAGALLHPSRNDEIPASPRGCLEQEFAGAGVTLRGWRCRPAGSRRGTLIYLHGVADNRGSSAGAIQRFTVRGLEVIAYDSRAHGKSDGEVCTYGFHEKADLRAVIDTLPTGPVILIGTSLGAGVALQEAAADRRVTGIVAAEVFSDLRTVIAERAPSFLPASIIESAVRVAEERGNFTIDAVSPARAAETIRVPVLLIHGDRDVDTNPAHAERVYDALAGPRRLLMVTAAGHNQSLSDGKAWTEIEGWVDAVLRTAAR